MDTASPEFLAELKVPAETGFIPAAKRLGATLGATVGFSLEEIDELAIAIAQACDSTIEACEEIWGEHSGATLKLTYGRTDKGISVDVEAFAPAPDTARRRQALVERRTAIEAAHRRNLETQRMAQEMIRFFVDDFRSSIDAGRGQVRFRMVKYLIG